jgi:hypothetical protein
MCLPFFLVMGNHQPKISFHLANFFFSIELFSHLLQSFIRTTNGAGCHLYTDKFYTSYELARETRNLNIHLTETVLGNRMGLPAEVVPLNMAVSEVKTY